jgi:hypothetical protein
LFCGFFLSCPRDSIRLHTASCFFFNL